MQFYFGHKLVLIKLLYNYNPKTSHIVLFARKLCQSAFIQAFANQLLSNTFSNTPILYYLFIKILPKYLSVLMKQKKSYTLFSKHFFFGVSLYAYGFSYVSLIIELTDRKTILEITVEIESHPATLDFKNISQYSSHSQ